MRTATGSSTAAATKPKPYAIGFLQLLGSGVLGAVGLTGVASARWKVVDGDTAIFLLLFVQWQTFWLTVAKCGLDHVVFATVGSDPTVRYDLRAPLKRYIIPLGCIAASIAVLLFPGWAAAAIGVSIVCDAYSLVVCSDLNARARFTESSIANLLNYPLFFGCVAALSSVGRAGRVEVIAAFVLTSVIRALWLRGLPRGRGRVVPTAQLWVAAQQVGNYGLFRADQLLLAVGTLRHYVAAEPQFVAAYLFLAKLPELAAGVFNAAGAVLFPLTSRDTRGASRLTNRALAVSAGIALLIIGISAVVVYLRLWNSPGEIPWRCALPFALHVALILPVNAGTYMMLSRGFASGLLRFIAVSLCAGAAVVVVVIVSRNAMVLAWVVPAQLSVFVAALWWGKRGKQTKLYRSRVGAVTVSTDA